MTLISLHQFLILYMWFGLVGIILFWALLTRAYQRLCGRRMYYSVFIIPIVLLGFVTIRATATPFNTAPSLEQILATVGGVLFLGLTGYVYRLMMSRT